MICRRAGGRGFIESLFALGARLAPLILLTAVDARAQTSPDSERVVLGAQAGIVWSPVRVTVNHGQEQTTGGVGVHFGLGVRPLARLGGNGFLPKTLRRIRLTPHFALTASHLRGIDPAVDSVAFSEFSLFGLRVTYEAVKRLHVFGIMRYGKRSAEVPRRVGAALDTDNVWGSAGTYGGGIHIPLTKSGRGLEIAALTSRGDFKWREVVDRVRNDHLEDVPVQIPFRAMWIQIGWSGPFTGASLPWQ